MKFKRGDVVKWAGATGIIKDAAHLNAWPLLVDFGDMGRLINFTAEGKMVSIDDPFDALELVERPKKKVTIKKFVPIYKTPGEGERWGMAYNSLTEALGEVFEYEGNKLSPIEVVPIVAEREIEDND